MTPAATMFAKLAANDQEIRNLKLWPNSLFFVASERCSHHLIEDVTAFLLRNGNRPMQETNWHV